MAPVEFKASRYCDEGTGELTKGESASGIAGEIDTKDRIVHYSLSGQCREERGAYYELFQEGASHTSCRGEIITTRSCTVNPGKTREAESQDSANLVGKGHGSLVDNAW